LIEALTAVTNPATVVKWLGTIRSARLLGHLARTGDPITHELLDDLPQTQALHYVREVLVSSGVLPARNEHLERLAPWLENLLAGKPAHHARPSASGYGTLVHDLDDYYQGELGLVPMLSRKDNWIGCENQKALDYTTLVKEFMEDRPGSSIRAICLLLRRVTRGALANPALLRRGAATRWPSRMDPERSRRHGERRGERLRRCAPNSATSDSRCGPR
jgi:hypothetical protein